MKKIIQILSIIAILMLSCTLFSGCGLIDELREQQAFYIDTDTIEYKNNTYVKLPDCEDLQPTYDYWINSPINVTNSDVPVLLSTFYSHFWVYEAFDDRFLVDVSSDSPIVYCRKEMYEEIISRINEGYTATKACYFYDKYNEETGEFKTEYYVFTDEQLEAVKDIMKSTNATVIPEDAYIDYTYNAPVEFASDDLLFRKHLIDIVITENNYYIYQYIDDGSTTVYTVPDEYKNIIAEAMKSYIESDDYFYDTYDIEETF